MNGLSQVSVAPRYTCAQIAAALGRTPQTVRQQLRDVRPAGVRIVAGNQSAAWTVDQLPEQIRGRLDAAAVQQRCRTVEALLSMPPQLWQPPVPLNWIAGIEIARAGKLRDALLPALLRQHDCDLSAAEFEAQGLADYAKVFGHMITARHWRTLFKRTLQRDAGAENYSRLEIYLPEDPALKKAPVRELSATLQEQFQELLAFIEAFRPKIIPILHHWLQHRRG